MTFDRDFTKSAPTLLKRIISLYAIFPHSKPFNLGPQDKV